MELKSAKEVAENVYQKLLNPKTSLDYSDPTIVIAKALESYANSRLEAAVQIFESLPPDGGRVKVEVVIESIRSLKSKESA